jgi:hypothetical protein
MLHGYKPRLSDTRSLSECSRCENTFIPRSRFDKNHYLIYD